ncbi:MAG: 16S rRNA (cytosine(967)-C(5))-methyltransferase RsmB [Desulfuromonadales bacterium]|jgi:16S rRNA (cytosine967-C5)-methyltransferase|nr:16S rRNA (cytosine(967)-C(5))-methyltransferase RsmB [Desulfuromonadales bacterium]
MPRNNAQPNPMDARYGAFDILQRVERGGYADRLLDHYLQRHPAMDARERGLLTELVYGILRLRGRLDFALAPFSRQPLQRLEPGALRLLRLGAYQLLELDRIPAHAAVHATVELAHQVGLGRVAGLINGTLRTLERERGNIAWPTPDNLRAYLQHVCSLPSWLAKELLRQFPNADSRALAEALTAAAPLTLRTNTLKTDRDTLLAALAEAGHSARACRYVGEGIIVEKRGTLPLPGDHDGWYQVQDEASMLIAHLLDAQSGETVLDACAAPGGKTTHIAALTGNRARILALDKHPQRVELIKQGADRIGCQGIEARCWDLTQQPDFLEPESFDRILVDAPCSGLGVLRRNPESRWSRRPADILALAELQRTILSQVAPLLRPGGHLLYSVCTFTAAETDAVVKDFLASQPGFVQEDFRPLLPAGWLELTTDSGCVRTLPHHHDGMDAFFAARFMKT